MPGKKPSGGLSVRAYAAHRKRLGLSGASPWAVSKALREGRITRTRAGKIDPARADLEWQEKTNEAKQRVGTTNGDEIASAGGNGYLPPGVPPFRVSRAIREAYEARIRQLKFEEESGRLVDAEAVRRETYRLGRAFRDKMLSLPERVAARCAAERSQVKIRALLDAEVRQLLEEQAGEG